MCKVHNSKLKTKNQKLKLPVFRHFSFYFYNISVKLALY